MAKEEEEHYLLDRLGEHRIITRVPLLITLHVLLKMQFISYV